MENVIVNLNGAISSIKAEEQKLLAEHITQINIYNTDFSSKVIEETLKKLSELKNWQETIEQIKQKIISSQKLLVDSSVIGENIFPTDVKEINNYGDEKIIQNITTEDVKTKIRTLAQHKFLFSTVFLMTDIRWSKDMFGLDSPFAKNYFDDIDLQEQVQNEAGAVHYWQEVFVLGEKKFLITNQWTEESKKKFATWYENITQLDHGIKTRLEQNHSLTITASTSAGKHNSTFHNDFSKKLKNITLLGKKYTIDFWSEVFIKVCEIMILKKPYLAAKFDQEKSLNIAQRNFSYQENEIKTDRKKLSNGMWIEISRTAQDSLELAITVLEFCGYSKDDIALEY